MIYNIANLIFNFMKYTIVDIYRKKKDISLNVLKFEHLKHNELKKNEFKIWPRHLKKQEFLI